MGFYCTLNSVFNLMMPDMQISENDQFLEFHLQEINHAGAGGLWAELVSNRGHFHILHTF